MKDSNETQSSIPLAYFITFTTYGTWLHGGKEKSVDRHHNQPNSAYISISATKEIAIQKCMTESPYLLDYSRRKAVLNTIKEVCIHKSWTLLAAHIRTNHVHLIVKANVSPERVMTTIKAYASRNLRSRNKENNRMKHWTRHGSTRYLWRSEHVVLAMRYVILEQGKPMALYKSNIYSLNIEECI